MLLNVGIEIGVFAYIAYEALNGEMSKTALVLYAVSVTDFTHWVEYIGETLSDIIPSNMLINDLREFLDIENSMENANGKSMPADKPYKIEIKDLSFTYPETDKVILDNINLTINAGERLALVGVNGAGKTTFVKLLLRFYDADSGEILYNGVNIKEYDIASLRQRLATVFQDYKVFALTISENVLCRELINDEDKFDVFSLVVKYFDNNDLINKSLSNANG